MTALPRELGLKNILNVIFKMLTRAQFSPKNQLIRVICRMNLVQATVPGGILKTLSSLQQMRKLIPMIMHRGVKHIKQSRHFANLLSQLTNLPPQRRERLGAVA